VIELTEQEKAEILSRCTTQSSIEYVMQRFNEPITPIRMIYTFKRATPKWPDQIFVYSVGQVDTRWWKKIRSLIQICERPGTRDESIDDHFRHRYHFFIYHNWEGLIEDEQEAGADQIFIDILTVSSKTYKILTDGTKPKSKSKKRGPTIPKTKIRKGLTGTSISPKPMDSIPGFSGLRPPDAPLA
jgi:hypothetical protein